MVVDRIFLLNKEQSVEELQTIGMSRYNKKYKYTENMLRKE
ncbi:hypothetical protein HMPREF0645_1156 [Hallella bergensis DSM 17361]|uniref:Uncharacterized protein n=1 Tax=Hallella bergensis DSM 17361 TaxID=585502 RepID=D1PW21_9BACT|nr:hypothetical protein HMPREF0645_1156 [Hallella bergensis DSM 17361]